MYFHKHIYRKIKFSWILVSRSVSKNITKKKKKEADPLIHHIKANPLKSSYQSLEKLLASSIK